MDYPKKSWKNLPPETPLSRDDARRNVREWARRRQLDQKVVGKALKSKKGNVGEVKKSLSSSAKKEKK